MPATLMREDGTLVCCGGFAEHFDHCDVGREMRHLHRLLVARDVIRDDANDANDRAWVAYSEAVR